MFNLIEQQDLRMPAHCCALLRMQTMGSVSGPYLHPALLESNSRQLIADAHVSPPVIRSDGRQQMLPFVVIVLLIVFHCIQWGSVIVHPI
jgi:hypothetical protein